MHIRNIGWPAKVSFGTDVDSLRFYVILDGAGGYRVRMDNVTIDNGAGYGLVFITGGAPSESSWFPSPVIEDESHDFENTDFGGSLQLRGYCGSPDNQDREASFEFDLMLEYPYDSDIWIPIEQYPDALLTLDDGDVADFGEIATDCFWTNVIFADQACDDAPAPGMLFSASGDNNATYVQLSNCIVATDAADSTGPTCFDLGASTYNGFVYFNLNNTGSGFFATYGAQPDGYTGSITDAELQQLDKITLDVINTTPLADVPIAPIDYANGNMFGGFGGAITGFPELTDDSFWRLTGQLDLTDGVTTGDPVSGVVNMACSQGPVEVYGLDFVEGGQSPNPFPFYEFIGNPDDGNSVTFADTGSYACDDLGPADFTVDSVPFTEPNFTNSCS